MTLETAGFLSEFMVVNKNLGSGSQGQAEKEKCR
jgi:hypothetical protein